MTASATEGARPVPGWMHRALRVLLAALAFGVTSSVLRAGIHTAFSPFRGGTDYLGGLVAGVAASALVGLVVALPLAFSARRAAWVAWWVLSLMALSGVSATSHYHAIFNAPADLTMVQYINDEEVHSSSDAALPLRVFVIEMVGAGVVACAVAWLLRRVSAGRERAALVALGAVLSLGAVSTASLRGAGQFHLGRTDPYVSAIPRGAALPAAVDVPGDDAAWATVTAALGWPATGGPGSEAPLCSSGRQAAHPRRERDVIVVVFEGLTERDMALEYGGRPVMPAVSAAFAESLYLENFWGSGAQTAAVLESHYAGLPANPHRLLLQHPPFADIAGFPSEFARGGWRTAYVHGASLNFENKRSFMGQVGFAELLEPGPGAQFDAGAWGEHDGATYVRLQAWIEARRAAGERYFATMMTLSTHHPYVVPADAARLATGTSDWEHFVNAYHYMDEAFAAFLAWYREHEAPRGTLLVLLGEHSPRLPYPSDPRDTSTGMFEHRFDVPFGVIGLDAAEQAALRPFASRPGGHADVGATLLGLAGLAPPRCGVGRDLLAPGADFPTGRAVVSHAGHVPYFLYVQEGDLRWMWDYRAARLRAYDLRTDPMLRTDLAPGHPERDRVLGLVAAYTRVTELIALRRR